MNPIQIKQAQASLNLKDGHITGAACSHGTKYLEQLRGVFEDLSSYEAMDPKTIVYEVESQAMVPEGTPGGLFFGTSYIHPGQVGNEYFMTKGHYHSRIETAEYYWGITGEGILLLMKEDGECWAEKVEEGSLHYIQGRVAHRLINTGMKTLAVGACWPSDAGHDYKSIEEQGFTAKVINVDGKVMIVRK